ELLAGFQCFYGVRRSQNGRAWYSGHSRTGRYGRGETSLDVIVGCRDNLPLRLGNAASDVEPDLHALLDVHEAAEPRHLDAIQEDALGLQGLSPRPADRLGLVETVLVMFGRSGPV